ncbi:SDR family NAD(P)-dependent oxidoreductase [Streptomyces gamaensis]|uniref:SDR family NAD(P)-dependent oxidoreductase n=1 Tax=Streptomyces gamaensis TaxID=1763542 RepID=A0ABW0YVG7_9ACTN
MRAHSAAPTPTPTPTPEPPEAAGDAVAVIGAACRLPGGIDSLDALWTALSSGRDLITDVPEDRFDIAQFLDTERRGHARTYTAAGGFLDDIAGFDTSYFRHISPREAEWLDPQQRILLELAVEALDDAAVDPASLVGGDTAVYIGVAARDYLELQTRVTDTGSPYAIAGSASANCANRISHFLDLRGPSLAVDTACSSALTALHEGCERLRAGTSRTVLAGGVNVLLSPYVYIGFCDANMLSPSGRCRTFSARADGYVRAEGGGLVLLKRLSDALADGDRVHAVILGSGTNSDGTTRGLALPNGAAQEALLREVYARAGVAPDDVVYFEAHGTATPVGDPAECTAIGRALCEGRTGGPLPIGSVKSNMGHLEAASGMAGLFKAMLVLREGALPPTLHAEPLNPAIDFDGLRLAPVLGPRPVGVGPSSAVGVNSFGFGGANAHVLLGRAPAPRPAARTPRGPVPVLVSARTAEALRAAAAALADRIETGRADGDFYDLAHTTALRRGHHPHSAAVLADGPDRATAALRAVARGEEPPPGSATAPRTEHGKVAFAFSGNGSQWPGMAADLLAREPVFRRAVTEADRAFAPHLTWSVREALASGPPAGRRLDATDVAQPMLFAVQWGLVALLDSHGIRPDAVVGHSVGETIAACVAGALRLPDAARAVVTRSRAQQHTAGTGGMAAVGLTEDALRAELADYGGALELSGINGERDMTVSGNAAALRDLEDRLTARDIHFRRLDLDYAFHSRAMDPLEESVRAGLAGIRPEAARIPLASTVTGTLAHGQELDATHWWHNMRSPVLFGAAVRTLREHGCDIFVEIGPHPVLLGYLRRASAQDPRPLVAVPACERDTDGPAAVSTCAARVLAAGARPDRNTYFPHPGRVVDLPAYPWQRTRSWRGAPHWWNVSGIGGDAPMTDPHPLLGTRLTERAPVWTGPLAPSRMPWLADHRVDGAVVLPAAAYVEAALAAGARLFDAPAELTRLTIGRALVLPWDEEALDVRLQTAYAEADQSVTLSGRTHARSPWLEHARGTLRRQLAAEPLPVDVAAVRARTPHTRTAAEHYERAARSGLSYGPAFRVLEELRTGDGEILATYRVPPDDGTYRVHPALLDGALQAGAPLLDRLGGTAPFLPVAIDRVRLWRTPGASGLVHVRCRELGEHEASWDVRVLDLRGNVTCEITGCRARRRPGGDGPAPARRLTAVLRARPGSAPGAATSPLPPPGELRDASAGRRAGAELSGEHGCKDAFAEFSAHFAARALAGLAPGGREFTLDDLTAAGMPDTYRPEAALLLRLTTRWGLAATAAPGHWRLTGNPDPEPLLRRSLDRFPRQAMAIALYGRCGTHLPAVLRGEEDPVQLLFSEADQHLIEHFYSDIAALRTDYLRARAVLRSLVRHWPADRPLRILEVGAGTGAVTAELLPLLPPERTWYVYSDVSPSFFTRAQVRLAAHDFVDYRTLDLDQDPAGQGFADGSFDLVVAANVLHATRDLRATLHRIRGLLAAGGQLLAVEYHDPEPMALCFGLLDGFWTFTDHDLRAGSPLLPAGTWLRLLGECGFADAVRANDPAEETDRSATGDHSLLLARRPADDLPPRPAALPPGDGDHWLLLAEHPGAPLTRHLAALLTEATRTRVTLASLRAPRRGPLVPDDARAPRVAVLLDEDTPAAADSAAVLEQAVRRVGYLRDLATACRELPPAVRPVISLVCRPSGALPAPEPPRAPGDAVPWGAARTLANEQPRLTVRRISLCRSEDPKDTEADARRLARELLAPDAEDEILLTPAGRFAARLVEHRPAPSPRDTATPRVLRVDVPGSGRRLTWVPGDDPRPGPGQVAIAVRAAALNYRDVMMAAGIYPPGGERVTPDGIELGLECAGEITAVGTGVTGLAPGDRVLAIGRRCLATHVVADARRCARVPDGTTFAGAATLPVVSFTVQHALDDLARLAPGETVLVHGAAGGIGLAALRHARERGCTVIATAGTPAKRELLRMLGARHALDSRSLDFAEHVRELTGGDGVDVVLNSLAGEAIPRSLELLRTGGRFVELGKRDIYASSPLPLAPFRNNLSYHAVDAHQLLERDTPATRATYATMAERIADGTYRPLPHQILPAARVDEAFDVLLRSRHLGKVVVSFDEPPPAHPAVPALPSLSGSAGTVLITGGLTGLGAATAVHLARRGIRRLALAGRRGPETPGADALLRTLADLGAEATAHAVDVSDPDAVTALLKTVEAGGGGLRGVVHGAMALDDGFLPDLTDDRIRAVLAPKLLGGLLLDTASRGRPLDFFAAYSSGAALTGNVQQAHYSAANLYLEALTRARRHAGHRAVTMEYGPIQDAGYVAREVLTAPLARIGWLPVTARTALTALDEHLTDGADVVFLDGADWTRIPRLLPAILVPRFAAVLPEAADGPDGSSDELHHRLRESDPATAHGTVCDVLAELLARILHHAPETLDRGRPLDELGVDSLMATEVTQAIRRRLRCEFSPVEIINAGNIEVLAGRVLARLGLTEGEAR